LLFDLDGVLLDSVPAYRRAWARWASEYGVQEAAIWSDAHGRRPRDIIERVAPTLQIERALVAFDRALEAERDGCTAMPGATECLRSLNSPWAIVTSGRRRHVEASLRAVGLPSPPVLVCGDDVSRGKPHPDGFLAAPRALHTEPPACVVIEDAPAGITAARSAGMLPVALTTTPHC
jgi:sugar-phosphatase